MHWSVNDTPAEVTNLPTQLLWGEDGSRRRSCGLRFRVRPNAFLQTNTAMAEKALRARARSGAAHRQRDGLGSLLRHRHDRPLARADALTVWGIEVSEESVACALENAELNGDHERGVLRGQRRPGRRRSCSTAPAPPDVVVVDPPRAGLAGKALRAARRDRGAAARLRLVQPDDARRRREELRERVRLRAPARRAGRHVPAHAARRDGGSARAAPQPRSTAPRASTREEGRDAMTTALRLRPGRSSTLRRSGDDANLHVQVTGATKRFHLWQQAPAWILGFAAIGLGFLMVLRGYDSAAGWFAVSTAVILSVIGSFRSPFSIGETSVSSAPGPSSDEEGDADRRIPRRADSRARAGRRSRATNPNERNGNAGRPSTSRAIARTIVKPYMKVIASQVQADAQLPARRRCEEERVEEDVRRPEVDRVAAGDEEGDRHRRVHLDVVRGDRLRRPGVDREDVDDRDDARDENDPGELLEEHQEVQPAKTAAQSFAKFAASPQSSSVKRNARSASAITAATRLRRRQSGSAT